MASRAKTYLSMAVRNWVKELTIDKLSLSPTAFSLRTTIINDHTFMVVIKDPHESASRYLEIKVTEKIQ